MLSEFSVFNSYSKISHLLEELRRFKDRETSQTKYTNELRAFAEKLKQENARLREEHSASSRAAASEDLSRMEEENRRLKEKLTAALQSNRSLEEALKKRDAEIREIQSNTRSLVGTLMSCLDSIPPSSSSSSNRHSHQPASKLDACDSASGLTVTSVGSKPPSSDAGVVEVNGNGSNSVKIRVAKTSSKAGDGIAVTSVPKTSTPGNSVPKVRK